MKTLGSDLLRRFTCGSGVLFGSVLLANQFKEEKEKRWSVITEYPKSKPNDVLLSRYGLFLLISARYSGVNLPRRIFQKDHLSSGQEWAQY